MRTLLGNCRTRSYCFNILAYIYDHIIKCPFTLFAFLFRFKQCLILFVVMGLNWTLELVSFLVRGPPQVWLVTDILNTLQGVIIFFVFVVRIRRVRSMAMDRLVPCIKNGAVGTHPQGRSRPKV